MKRTSHGLIRSHREDARRYTTRVETSRPVQPAERHRQAGRVSGALSQSASADAGSFGEVSVLAAEIIGEYRCTELSILWTVLGDRSRYPQTPSPAADKSNR
jgi:hypothetical protein